MTVNLPQGEGVLDALESLQDSFGLWWVWGWVLVVVLSAERCSFEELAIFVACSHCSLEGQNHRSYLFYLICRLVRHVQAPSTLRHDAWPLRSHLEIVAGRSFEGFQGCTHRVQHKMGFISTPPARPGSPPGNCRM